MTTLSSTERGEHTPGIVERLEKCAALDLEIVRNIDAMWNALNPDNQRPEVAATESQVAMIEAADLISELVGALEETWRVIRAAGLLNLTKGVQLGQTSWYVKACDAEKLSDAAIAKATGGEA